MKVNPHASALGKLNKGKKKKYSPEQIRKLTERLIYARKILAEKRKQSKKEKEQNEQIKSNN